MSNNNAELVLREADAYYPEDEADIMVRELIYHTIGESREYHTDLFTVTAPYEVVISNENNVDADAVSKITQAVVKINEPKFTRLRTFLFDLPTTKLILTEAKYKAGFRDFVNKVKLKSYKVEFVNIAEVDGLRITFWEKY